MHCTRSLYVSLADFKILFLPSFLGQETENLRPSSQAATSHPSTCQPQTMGALHSPFKMLNLSFHFKFYSLRCELDGNQTAFAVLVVNTLSTGPLTF